MSLTNVDIERITRTFQENPAVVDFLNSLSGIPTQVASGQLVNVADTGLADTEFTITHTLKDADGNERTPVGVYVVNQSIAGSLYAGVTPDTGTIAYRKFSAANANIDFWVF